MQNSTRIIDLRNKEVINLDNGMRLGYVFDIEFDIENGKVISLLLPGALRLFGLFGRHDDISVPWDKIEKIGDDIILVNVKLTGTPKPRKIWLNI